MRPHYEEQWRFETAAFTVVADTTDDYDLDLFSWDDTGEVRDGLESGKFISFQVRVRVLMNGHELSADYLGGCIYNSVNEFFTSHWDSPADSRNTIANDHRVGHYFPDMVKTAIKEARQALAKLQSVKVRTNG